MKAPAVLKAAARAIVGKSARAALDEATRRHDELNLALGAAEEALVAAVEKRTQAVDQDDDVLDQLDQAVERAKVAHQRALERFRAACNRMDEAEAELDREMAADRAKRAAAIRSKVEPLIPAAFAEAAKGVLLALKHAAQADAELAELEALPEGRSPRSVEHGGRFKGWLSEQEVSRREVELWSTTYGDLLENQPHDSKVGQDRDGYYLMRDSGSNSVRFGVRKARFHRIEFRSDRLNRRRWFHPLATLVTLPGIGDPDERLWPPAREPIAQDPTGLLRQLDAALALVDSQLEALQQRRDDREIEVRFERIEDSPAPAGDEAEDGDDE